MTVQHNTSSGDESLEVNKIIAPEIKNDAFYELIVKISSSEDIKHVLEIGSSAGGGSTEAFVTGLSQNPHRPNLYCVEISRPRFEVLRDAYSSYSFVHCYNRSTVTAEDFPHPSVIREFYATESSGLKQFPLDLVLGWLQQDINYVQGSGVAAGAIEQIKADHGIDTFDMVLIDGSEFTGLVEYEKIRGARIILLDDTNTFKCWHVRRRLLADPTYELIADNQTLRNGYSAFRRRDARSFNEKDLPIHFFTIVLNGEPFIRYHENVFSKLPFRWHWHVVEGVANLVHDTGWSVTGGGRIPAGVHFRGRSNDGTSTYLDDLVKRYPNNITIYRKPPDIFWDGKKEMVNAPLANITEGCLLWQVDNDELWTVDQIQTVRRMFLESPDRSAARYWCWYYVGPDKIISTRHNYAQNPKQEWLRTWRFSPGAAFESHEPPVLVRYEVKGAARTKIDIATQNPFTHAEMERSGCVFHHLAYVTPEQLAFKENYYGYGGATEKWVALNACKGSGFLKDYFAWVNDQTMFDDSSVYGIEPLAYQNPITGAWSFGGQVPKRGESAAVEARVVVDGIFWQYLSSGIARVWENLIQEWIKSGFIKNVIILDRAGTAPRFAGAHYFTIERHDYAQTGRDSQYLEEICQFLKADIFVSTYYSSPLSTPSFFSGYDMIPEMLGFPMEGEVWNEKRRAILHASGHSMISRNSAKDLETLYSEVKAGSTYVVHVAAAPTFTARDAASVKAFAAAHGLSDKPYVVMVGERLGYRGYKNGQLVTRALAAIQADKRPVLICIGGHELIEDEMAAAGPGVKIKRLKLSDEELAACYSGAFALIYPSRYEGFGMPPLEAMACGAPAIVCRNSSLPEVVGDAGLYVDEQDPSDLARALISLYEPERRAELVKRGHEHAAKFSFERMAREMADALTSTSAAVKTGKLPWPGAAWAELRDMQRAIQQEGLTITSAPVGKQALTLASTGAVASPRTMAVTASEDLRRALDTIDAMKKSPFWKLRERVVFALRRARLRIRT